MKGKRALAATLLEGSGLGRGLRRLGVWRGLLVFNYHRIAHTADELFDTGVWSATPDELATQVAFLQRHSDLLAPGDLASVEPALHGRYTLITFDDGYRDNHDLAFPVLTGLGASAVFFPTTAWVDEARPSGWDELAWMLRERRADLPRDLLPADLPADAPFADRAHAVQRRYRSLSPSAGLALLDRLADALGTGRLPAEQAGELWMTWDQMRAMSAAGMAFGGHTAHHVCLSTLDEAGQQTEIDNCAGRLRAELGRSVDFFAYPFGMRGSFDEATSRCLDRAGVRYGCSQYGGYQSAGQLDRHNVRRVAVERTMDAALFAATVSAPGVFAR